MLLKLKNIKTTTYPARAKIRVALSVVVLSNLIRHKYDNMPEYDYSNFTPSLHQSFRVNLQNPLLSPIPKIFKTPPEI